MSSPRTLELDDLERGKPKPRQRVESEATGADLGIPRHRRTLSESSSDSIRCRQNSNYFTDLPGYHDHEPGAPHDPNHIPSLQNFTRPPAYFPRAADSFHRTCHKIGAFFHKGLSISWVHLAILAFFITVLLAMLLLMVVPMLFFSRHHGTVITVSPHFNFQEPFCSCPPLTSSTSLSSASSSNSLSTSSPTPSSRPVKTIIDTFTQIDHVVKTVVNQPTIVVDEAGHTSQAPPTATSTGPPITLRVGESDVAKNKEVVLSIVGKEDKGPEPTTAPGRPVTIRIADDEVHANATIMLVVVGDDSATSTGQLKDAGSAAATATSIQLEHGDTLKSA